MTKPAASPPATSAAPTGPIAPVANSGPLQSSRRPWVYATLAIVFVAIFLRLVMNLRHALAPGMDAAYYPMQVRWLIEYGELQMPAMPLTFWISSLLAQLLTSVTSMSLENTAQFACRLTDGFCQPWTAVPIMLLGYRWSGGRRSAVLVCASIASLAVLSPPIFRMASDLQKNSLGLVWMAFGIWAMRESLAQPGSLWRWGCLAILFLLAGLTHIGAFGATCVILIGCLLAYVVMEYRVRPTRKNVVFAGGLAAGLGVMFLVVWFLVPSQIQRLWILTQRVISPRIAPASIALSVVAYGIVAFVLRRLWAIRGTLERCDLAVAIGVCGGIAVLVAPVLQGTWAMRFLLIAIVPATILLSLLATKLEIDIARHWPRKALITTAAILAIASPLAMQGPVISEAAAEELRRLDLGAHIPSRTLVIAPHGLEFWAGFLMQVRAKTGAIPDDFTPYDRVFLLKPTAAASGHGPPLDTPRRGHHPPRPDHQPARHEIEIAIPEDAKLIHQSKLFSLYELPEI